eukprot:TRINITY_DN16836_c0_g2_i1.p1 TRINITY_DN16836_c0_g2~~TRINITY_DN16836_c0_g2_i1.p1  ORF type:complete len:1359 (+),score=354.98 TRINITY_DN16836_c0_g2_i1:151-4227(+)
MTTPEVCGSQPTWGRYKQHARGGKSLQRRPQSACSALWPPRQRPPLQPVRASRGSRPTSACERHHQGLLAERSTLTPSAVGDYSAVFKHARPQEAKVHSAAEIADHLRRLWDHFEVPRWHRELYEARFFCGDDQQPQQQEQRPEVLRREAVALVKGTALVLKVQRSIDAREAKLADLALLRQQYEDSAFLRPRSEAKRLLFEELDLLRDCTAAVIEELSAWRQSVAPLLASSVDAAGCDDSPGVATGCKPAAVAGPSGRGASWPWQTTGKDYVKKLAYDDQEVRLFERVLLLPDVVDPLLLMAAPVGPGSSHKLALPPVKVSRTTRMEQARMLLLEDLSSMGWYVADRMRDDADRAASRGTKLRAWMQPVGKLRPLAGRCMREVHSSQVHSRKPTAAMDTRTKPLPAAACLAAPAPSPVSPYRGSVTPLSPAKLSSPAATGDGTPADAPEGRDASGPAVSALLSVPGVMERMDSEPHGCEVTALLSGLLTSEGEMSEAAGRRRSYGLGSVLASHNWKRHSLLPCTRPGGRASSPKAIAIDSEGESDEEPNAAAAAKEVSATCQHGSRQSSLCSGSDMSGTGSGLGPGFQGTRSQTVQGLLRQLSNSSNGTRVKNIDVVFTRLMHDGCIHKDDLLRALETAGVVDPRQDWVDEVVKNITSYSTLSHDEFLDCIVAYHNISEAYYCTKFKQYDADKSGLIERGELAALLSDFGIEPLEHILDEVLGELGCLPDGGITDLQFKDVVQLLEKRQCYTKSEYEELLRVYHLLERDRRNGVAVTEVRPALDYLGLPVSPKIVQLVVSEIDVDRSGKLNVNEYLMCMRRLREHDIDELKDHLTHTKDDRLVVKKSALKDVMKTMNYFTTEKVVEETLQQTGLPAEQEELDISQLYKFLAAYRAREGLSSEDLQNIKASFVGYCRKYLDVDEDGDPEAMAMPTKDIGVALRSLGLWVPFEQLQMLITRVDIGLMTTIDAQELCKVIRMLRTDANFKAMEAFCLQTNQAPDSTYVQLLTTGTTLYFVDACVAVMQLSALEPSLFPEELKSHSKKHIGITEFLDMASQAEEAARKAVVSRGGFSQKDIAEFKEKFTKFDWDKSGEISKRELANVIHTCMPAMASDPALRPRLLEILEEVDVNHDCSLDFDEFVMFMRHCRELRDIETVNAEQQAVTDTGFSQVEVQEFREVFLEHAVYDENEQEPLLTLDDFLSMMSKLGICGDIASVCLTSLFRQVTGTERGREIADFGSYLRLMHLLIQRNFGQLNEKTARIASRIRESQELLLRQLGACKRMALTNTPDGRFSSMGGMPADAGGLHRTRSQMRQFSAAGEFARRSRRQSAPSSSINVRSSRRESSGVVVRSRSRA